MHKRDELIKNVGDLKESGFFRKGWILNERAGGKKVKMFNLVAVLLALLFPLRTNPQG